MLTDYVVLLLSDKEAFIVEMNVLSVHSGITVFYFKINKILLEFDKTNDTGTVH